MLQEEKHGLPPQEKLVIKAVCVPGSKIVDGVAFYLVKVTGSFNSWCVAKRYSQFEELQSALSEVKGFPSTLDLPPKRFKLFVSHISPPFLEERRVLLESYLKKLVAIEEISKNQIFTAFLTSDKTTDDVKTKTEKKKIEDIPDDIEVTGVTIPATRQMSDHILYQIDIVNSRKEKEYAKWTVLKRFGQFYEMDSAVRGDFADKLDILNGLPAAPQRKAKLLNDHMDENFVEQRRVLLENYLLRMLENPHVIRNKSFLSFLGVSGS